MQLVWIFLLVFFSVEVSWKVHFFQHSNAGPHEPFVIHRRFHLGLDGSEKLLILADFYWHTGSFAHKIFPVVWGTVFCPVSGFCTSDGFIKILFIQKIFFCISNIFLRDHTSEKDFQACSKKFLLILCMIRLVSINRMVIKFPFSLSFVNKLDFSLLRC